MELITPQELSEQLKAGCRLLDVREKWETEVASLPGSVHIPMGDVTRRYQELDPDQEWIVYCHHGIRSANVIAFLKTVGFEKLKNLRGGIDAWSRHVDSTVPRY
ncbi:MAG: rhodanese-like domain-containing protein [Acidobacteriota bacterium]